jgi:CubicO group peptidase (beta-lactamase class C family)
MAVTPLRVIACWRIAVCASLIFLTGCSTVSSKQNFYPAKVCEPQSEAETKPFAIPKVAGATDVSVKEQPAIRAKSVPGASVAELNDLILTNFSQRQIHGGVVAIISQGKIQYAKGFGVANLDTAEPVTLETRFWTGSMGKQFTAMAVMMLVEQGRLALDNSVSSYLPQLPLSYKAVTVRHLLTHTSGIKRDFVRRSCPPFFSESMSDEVLFEALRETDLEFEPGSALRYTNTGYTLLGMLIEKVSGTSYRVFLKTHIFDPLEMTATHLVGPEDRGLAHLAAGHEWRNGRDWVMRPALRFGSGNIITTVIDLAKWDAALYTESLVSQKSLSQIWTPHRLNNQQIASLGWDDQGIQYKIGFGWFINDEPENFVVHHGGELDGNSAQIDRYISKKLTIVVMVNREQAALARGIAREVASYYFQYLRSISAN